MSEDEAPVGPPKPPAAPQKEEPAKPVAKKAAANDSKAYQKTVGGKLKLKGFDFK